MHVCPLVSYLAHIFIFLRLYPVTRKVKCSGTMPCSMCTRKGLQCEFSLKQKPGPKVGYVTGMRVD